MAETPSHCAECVFGDTDAGTPAGIDIMLNGTIHCYVAKSTAETDKAVMLIPDVFGHVVPNIRLMADRIATKGFNVYVPDLQSGECLKPEMYDIIAGVPGSSACGKFLNGTRFFASIPSLISWMGRHNEPITLPLIDKALEGITALGAKKIGVAGYCWGAKYSILLGATDKVQAIIAAHPSGLSMPKDIVNLKQHALLLCANNDFTFSNANAEMARTILAEKSPGNIVKLYQGVKHGFAIRGDENDPVVCAARNDSLDLSIEFFIKNLA